MTGVHGPSMYVKDGPGAAHYRGEQLTGRGLCAGACFVALMSEAKGHNAAV